MVKLISGPRMIYKCKYIITTLYYRDNIDWTRIKRVLWEGLHLLPIQAPILGQMYTGWQAYCVILETLSDNNYIWCSKIHWELLKHLPPEILKQCVLFTGYGEDDFVPCNLRYLDGLFRCRHYFVTSKIFEHSKITSLPWGISTQHSRISKDYPHIDDVEKLISELNIYYKDKLIFGRMNAQLEINGYSPRIQALKDSQLYDKVNLYTNENPQRLSFPEYLKEIAQHHFLVIPPGNINAMGTTDDPKIWESLYCNTIPIVDNSIGMNDFTKYFPILTVDKWSDIHPNNLTKTRYEDIMAKYDGWRKHLDVNYFFENYIKEHIND